MPKPTIEAVECRVVGRLGRAPEKGMTLGGMPVCRMVVVGKAAGPASSPPKVALYTKDDLARRCGRSLGKGDLIEATGSMSTEQRPNARYPEFITKDVKLWERAAERTGAP